MASKINPYRQPVVVEQYLADSTKEHKSLIIYFTKDQKNYQIVKPHPDHFKGDWGGLAWSISGGDHSHYKIV